MTGVGSRARVRRTAGLVAALALGVLAAAPAYATSGVTTRRLAGVDRYATAAAISQATFGAGGTGTAVLASGERFPDALAASYLAGRLNAPVLLTAGDSLSSAVIPELRRLGASGVDVVGGTAAVGDAVVAQLEDAGLQVDRVAGVDRYATARAVAELFSASFVGALGAAGPTAIVTSGENFPDALAGAPLGYSAAFPVLLTPAASLSGDAAGALRDLGIEQALVLGGTSAVSAGVAQSIADLGIAVRRIAGADRGATAADVADLEVAELGWAATHANLARGDDFADALAGGTHEGVEQAPVLLTVDPATLGDATAGWLRAHASTIASVDVLGGTAAVSDATVAAAKAAATP